MHCKNGLYSRFRGRSAGPHVWCPACHCLPSNYRSHPPLQNLPPHRNLPPQQKWTVSTILKSEQWPTISCFRNLHRVDCSSRAKVAGVGRVFEVTAKPTALAWLGPQLAVPFPHWNGHILERSPTTEKITDLRPFLWWVDDALIDMIWLTSNSLIKSVWWFNSH